MPRRGHELWRQTCMELFIAEQDSRSYLEINLAPSGAWNCYEFSDYREGMKVSDCCALTDISQPSARQLRASLTLEKLYPPYRINPTVIVKQANGSIAYFADRHGAKPDFHDSALHLSADRL